MVLLYTTTCAAPVKSVVAEFILGPTLWLFLAAFDMVQFDMLFRKSQSRGLPLPFFVSCLTGRVSDQFSATITSDSFFLCSGRTTPNAGSGFR